MGDVPTLEWADEIQIGAASVAGAVTFGDWIRNAGDSDADAGWGHGLIAVIDSSGSHIAGQYLHPASAQMAPQEATWMEVTVPLAAGTYGVTLDLMLGSDAVADQRKLATVVVSADGVELRAGSLPEAPAVDTRVPVLQWTDDIQVTADSIAGAVTFGDWIQNAGDFDAAAGWGRGLLAVIDSSGSHVFGAYLSPPSAQVAPGESTWTAVTAPIQEGTYGVTLDLIIGSDVVPDQQLVATAVVSDDGVELTGGSLP